MQKYKISESSVGRIIKNKTWKDKNYKRTRYQQLRLTWKDIAEIRYEYNFNNQSIKSLVQKYKACASNIRLIIRNKSWKDENYKRTRH